MAINRRGFLGLTIGAFGGSRILALDELFAQDVKKSVRNDVIEPLRDYVYARYDVSALKQKRDDLPELEDKLKKALSAAGLPAETILSLKDGKKSAELEEFFEKQDLTFRSINFIGTSSPLNYELVKIDSKEEKETTVFGIAHKYTKIRIVDPELITNSFNYLAKKKDLKVMGITSAVWHGRNTIEYRTALAEELSKVYFSGESEKGEKLEEDAKDWKRIDEYYLGKKEKSPHKFLYDHMGTVLHHIAVRDIFKQSKNEAEFKSKLLPIWERDADIRSVMNLIDDFEYEEVTKGLAGKDEQELRSNIIGHRETRALLAQMHHGSPHQYVGSLLKILGMDTQKEMISKKMASLAVMGLFISQIVADRKSYNNIDLSSYAPKNEGVIIAQLGNLSENQIRKLSKDTFEAIYQGQSFKVYMLEKANEIKKKYD